MLLVGAVRPVQELSTPALDRRSRVVEQERANVMKEIFLGILIGGGAVAIGEEGFIAPPSKRR